MAGSFDVVDDTVCVRLSGEVDGYDLMHIHGDDDFLALVREKRRVVFDYTRVTDIRFSHDDVTLFAKLAVLESSLTPGLRIGVIPKDKQHQRDVRAYRDMAKNGGADVSIDNSPNELAS